MFAALDAPDHAHRLPRPPVLGLSPVLLVDGGTAVQGQGSAGKGKARGLSGHSSGEGSV